MAFRDRLQKLAVSLMTRGMTPGDVAEGRRYLMREEWGLFEAWLRPIVGEASAQLCEYFQGLSEPDRLKWFNEGLASARKDGIFYMLWKQYRRDRAIDRAGVGSNHEHS